MTEHAPASLVADAEPMAGWFVTSTHPLIHQRFYAALDCDGRLCWTDDPAWAEQFPLQADAERFAVLTCPEEDWMLCAD